MVFTLYIYIIFFFSIFYYCQTTLMVFRDSEVIAFCLLKFLKKNKAIFGGKTSYGLLRVNFVTHRNATHRNVSLEQF